jgi:raffinose/stachyose/melibiose transport system substrate-binding protein
MKMQVAGKRRGMAVLRGLPLILIAAAFLWSVATIVLRRTQEAPAGVVTLRIGHWQLETGVREAFRQLGADFAALPEVQARYGKVQILQDAIPDSSYGQWLTSQMMGETAPDLVEMGMLPDPILRSYESRYFLPLNALAAAPNPFNKGTPLEGLPLRETFSDGMRSGYAEELQSYTKVPLSRFTSRIFYNRTLLEKLTGKGEVPRDLGAFVALCREISQKTEARSGQRYIPIASSSWHLPHWLGNIAEPLTYPNVFVADYSRDGEVGSDEIFAAIDAGRMHLTDPPWEARFEVTRELTAEFNPGFAGIGRDEALFLFAQQKAVFISTGIWDVSSLQDQARGKFEVGIADFPRPSAGDPALERFALGPLYDPAWAAFPFGVYRLSKHPELAEDFLRYLASARGNEKLNQIVGWIPVISGARIPASLARFAPVDQGIFAAGSLTLGGDTLNAYTRAFSEFLTNPGYSYNDFLRDFLPAYRRLGRLDWDEMQRDYRRGEAPTERTLAAMRGQALLESALSKAPEAPSATQFSTSTPWLTYRNYLATRQVMLQLERHAIDQLVTPAGEAPRPVAPYDYLPEALVRARRHLRVEAATAPAP